jgi:hypothetical protein
MNQPIVIQDLGEATADWISKEAERRGVSVEAVVVELLHKGIGIERDNSQLQVYHDLDWFIGTWTEEEADEFLKAIEDFEQVDEELWQNRV